MRELLFVYLYVSNEPTDEGPCKFLKLFSCRLHSVIMLNGVSALNGRHIEYSSVYLKFVM